MLQIWEEPIVKNEGEKEAYLSKYSNKIQFLKQEALP